MHKFVTPLTNLSHNIFLKEFVNPIPPEKYVSPILTDKFFTSIQFTNLSHPIPPNNFEPPYPLTCTKFVTPLIRTKFLSSTKIFYFYKLALNVRKTTCFVEIRIKIFLSPPSTCSDLPFAINF